MSMTETRDETGRETMTGIVTKTGNGKGREREVGVGREIEREGEAGAGLFLYMAYVNVFYQSDIGIVVTEIRIGRKTRYM